MRLKLIACKALFRELSYLSALSENSIDATWIRQGCHDHPEQLSSNRGRKRLPHSTRVL